MPRYTHDCEDCRFLGEYGEHDLYFCPRCDGGSVIARNGHNGPNYASSPRALLTPERRAQLAASTVGEWGRALLAACSALDDTVTCIRKVCARELGEVEAFPFFHLNYLKGEKSDDAILRLYFAEADASGIYEPEEIALVLCHG